MFQIWSKGQSKDLKYLKNTEYEFLLLEYIDVICSK